MISPLKLGTTWCNRISGSIGIGKWLDRFLVARSLLPLLSQHRVWTRPSEIYDHSLICLEWMEVGRIISYPFKFNHTWLKEAPFTYLIKLAWPQNCVVRDVDAMSRLVGKLKVLKRVVTNWEHWLKHD